MKASQNGYEDAHRPGLGTAVANWPSGNLERVQTAYAAYEVAGTDALFPYFAPDIEWDMTQTALDSRVHTGHEDVRRFFRGLTKTWEAFGFRYGEYIDAGEEVVAIGRFYGRGRASGVEIEAVIAHIWMLREGMAVRVRAYLDRREALRAAGFAPPAREQV